MPTAPKLDHTTKVHLIRGHLPTQLLGSRLTAYELVYENIPSTLITDSMVSAAVETFKIDAIVVGADRVSRNGDTANKIGKSVKVFSLVFYKEFLLSVRKAPSS